VSLFPLLTAHVLVCLESCHGDHYLWPSSSESVPLADCTFVLVCLESCHGDHYLWPSSSESVPLADCTCISVSGILSWRSLSLAEFDSYPRVDRTPIEHAIFQGYRTE
jgi:hypothetical protein